MESRFLYFYPRNRHRGFDPVNVTNSTFAPAHSVQHIEITLTF
jgi:hypothetical protein